MDPLRGKFGVLKMRNQKKQWPGLKALKTVMVKFTENIIRRGCENANSDVHKLTKSTNLQVKFFTASLPLKNLKLFFGVTGT